MNGRASASSMSSQESLVRLLLDNQGVSDSKEAAEKIKAGLFVLNLSDHNVEFLYHYFNNYLKERELFKNFLIAVNNFFIGRPLPQENMFVGTDFSSEQEVATWIKSLDTLSSLYWRRLEKLCPPLLMQHILSDPPPWQSH